MPPRAASTLAALLGVLTLAACGGSAASSKSASASQSSSASAAAASAQLSFEGVALEPGPSLASAASTQTQTVDGIRCGLTEQLAYHVHAHLAVFFDGQPYSLPGGIGIPGSVVQTTGHGPVAAGGQCIYWLHTHAPDGVIHIESPTQRIYTLGNFFDEWHQPLSGTRVAALHGKIIAFINGRLWPQSLRAIPLLPHASIQLDVGAPAALLTSVDWSQTQL